jgi:hypothetical protein
MRLKNLTKRMVVLTCPHDEVCHEECHCVPVEHMQTAHNPATGDVGVRQVAMRLPQSVHIPAGAETEELPETFLKARQVRSALLTRDLRKVS